MNLLVALLHFLKSGALAGITLMCVAVIAMMMANGPWADTYIAIQNVPMFGHTLTYWVNDALMALFFLLVGLEIKREVIAGQLATWRERLLPGITALGGMIIPAGIYAAFNFYSPETLRGWAIPAATDIAFALGVLMLFGSRVPISLKVFLTALAILDDLGAILLIAAFYTEGLNLIPLALAAVVTGALVVLNRGGVRALWPYLVSGVVLWLCVYQSGLHATLAGVILAMTIPMPLVRQNTSSHDAARRAEYDLAEPEPQGPLMVLEHKLQPLVAFAVLPIFGFLNAGVNVAGLGLNDFNNPVTLGIFFGLFVGKQIGVGAALFIAIRWLNAPKPVSATIPQIYATTVLCGIGFTMSMFIGNLAFTDTLYVQEMKLGILSASLLSAVVGGVILGMTGKNRRTRTRGIGDI